MVIHRQIAFPKESCNWLVFNGNHEHQDYLSADHPDRDITNSAFDAMLKKLISVDENGFITMLNIVSGCGLGGNPFRDVSSEYYINEKHVDNDINGVAPFILAAIELERKLSGTGYCSEYVYQFLNGFFDRDEL